jgi:hypothetical protein
MAMVEINWNPDQKTLSGFSEAGMVIMGMLAAPLFYFYYGLEGVGIGLWAAALALRLLGLFRTEWVKPLFLGLTLLTFPIGWVVSHIVLALLFYMLFTPVALVFRLMGRDPLNRRLDPQAETYWEAYNPDRGRERYLRQF